METAIKVFGCRVGVFARNMRRLNEVVSKLFQLLSPRYRLEYISYSIIATSFVYNAAAYKRVSQWPVCFTWRMVSESYRAFWSINRVYYERFIYISNTFKRTIFMYI